MKCKQQRAVRNKKIVGCFRKARECSSITSAQTQITGVADAVREGGGDENTDVILTKPATF